MSLDVEALYQRYGPMVLRRCRQLLQHSVSIFVVFQDDRGGQQDLTISPQLEQGIRLKGLAPHLRVFRKTGEQVELLQDLSHAQVGDVIQLTYVPVSQSYGMIFSIDGNGMVTQHFPDNEIGPAATLTKATEVRLNNAYELDDAPLFERFYFVTSPSVFLVEDIISVANTLASEPVHVLEANLILPKELQYSQFTLKK